MRHVNYTNIYKALRKAYDSRVYEPVNDEWRAGFDCWDRAVLFNDFYEIRTGSISGCTSMTDLLKFATGLLMKDFKEHPWYELDEDEHDAFSSATSFHVYGESKIHWKYLFALDEDRLDEIWLMAFWYVAEGKAPDDWRTAA